MRRPATLGLVALVLSACDSAPSADALPCDPARPERDGRALLFPDVDGDGHGAGEPQPVCVEPGVTPAGWARTDGDCAPEDSSAFRAVTGFYDEDGDGVGTEERTVCVGAEAPTTLVERGDDCAPRDPTRWRLHAYAAVDADGDGHPLASRGQVCAQDTAPPAYSETPPTGPEDCDDDDPERFTEGEYYEDVDGDGRGSGAIQTVCHGFDGVPPGYAQERGDCAPEDPERDRIRTFGYRDADGDGVWVATSTTVCAGDTPPRGYAETARDEDCDDADSAVFRTYFYRHRDADGDGYSVPQRGQLCVGADDPAGYLMTASAVEDCDDADPAVFRNFPYAHRDADADGYTAPEAGEICVGAEDPVGYLTAASAIEDCDDADPARFETLVAYVDADGDGYGVAPGRPMCTDGTLPAGEAPVGADCAPADPSHFAELTYVAVDRDGDGASVPETGTLCTGGALPAPFLATESGQDCDDTDPARFALTLLFDDGDGDGVGAGPWRKQCLGAALPAGTSRYGDDPDDADPLVSVDEDLTDLLLLEQ